MPEELMISKLFIPPLRADLVARPRLVQLLNEGLGANRRLTLISAPAGFGKTTLVVDWLKQAGLPTAWLSLDEADNDLPRFLAYIAAALQRADEELGASLVSALQSPQLPAVEKVLTALLNEIAARKDPLILVLDDYHLLSESAILEAVDFLLHNLPPQLHLVLTTREDPDLPLARLRARDQLNEIRARDLRFTRDEAASFLRGVMGLGLSEQDVAALEGRTEGWAAGLQLAGLSIQKLADPKSFIAEFSGSHRHILDYLTSEVLQQQPEDTRSFLLQTAILDRLSPPLCDAITLRADSAHLLARLEAANLFVIPLDEERRWYRYHHLFSDLLRSQLARSQPGTIPELHRRASRWFEENGDSRLAIEHALQDSDLTRAARLIEQHAMQKLYQGHVALVLGWFDRLPEEIMGASPMMCIEKAWALALIHHGARQGDVDPALMAAMRALDQVKANKALRDLVAGHAASIRAYLYQSSRLGREKSETLITLSQEAQQLLPEDEKAIRSVNALNMAVANLALARLDAARIAYQQTFEDGLAGGNLYAAVFGPIGLSYISVLAGNLEQALQVCETNIERFNQHQAGQSFPILGALYIFKGSILLERNRLIEAEGALVEGLDLMYWTREHEAHRRGDTALARLRAIQGDRPAMLAATKTLDENWPESAFFAQALRHRLALRHWPADSQAQADAHAWLAHSGIEFEDLALMSGVNPDSDAIFTSYINAAHVLARLVKARPGVFPVEGVHTYLSCQVEFAAAHEIVSWLVEIAMAQTLLYWAEGHKQAALESLHAAIAAAAHTGLLRIFLDESDVLQALLEELKPRLKEQALIDYTNRLLEAMGSATAKPESKGLPEALLSEREIEVLQCLAKGLTYEETGRQLYLSLNTVQFHVKNIYGKLLVNKRLQAIEKAREMKLI